jgi:hypothetical protein
VQLVRANVHLVPSEEPYSSYEVAALHTSLTEGANLRRDSSADELLSVASGVDAAASGPNLTHILYQNMQVWTGPILEDVEAARKAANRRSSSSPVGCFSSSENLQIYQLKFILATKDPG